MGHGESMCLTKAGQKFVMYLELIIHCSVNSDNFVYILNTNSTLNMV